MACGHVFMYKKAVVCMEPTRVVFFSFSLPWMIVDDPPSTTRPKGNGVRARLPSAMLSVEGEILGCPCFLSFVKRGGNDVLIPARPDRGEHEEAMVRAT